LKLKSRKEVEIEGKDGEEPENTEEEGE